jgi:hypothetical protein
MALYNAFMAVMDLKRVDMQGNVSNPFSQQPGKTAINKELFQTLDGQWAEIVWYQKAVLENGVLKKEGYFWVDPPLEGGRIPESIHQIRQCGVCRKLFHQDSVRLCQDCRMDYCGGIKCRGTRKSEGDSGTEGEIEVCKKCADEANIGPLEKLIKTICNLNE